MRVTRTIKYPEGSLDTEIRAGFEKGTLRKVTLELHNGHTIIYEDGAVT